MSEALGAVLSGDRLVGRQFQTLSARLRARIVTRFEDLAERLLADVEASEPFRTGKLRGETQTFLREGESFITAGVRVKTTGSADGGKAAALEYGAHNPAQVKEHTRRLSTVFGRVIEPMQVLIDPYTRTPDIDSLSYLRGPLERIRPDVLAAMEDAVTETLDEAL